MLKKLWVGVSKLMLFSLFFNTHLNSQNSTSNLNFEMMKQLNKPAYLEIGDTISIVATAGVVKEKDRIENAVALAESWGLNVILGEHLFEDNNHFAGTDAQRLSDFQKALDDKTVKAIWCARGGYGTVRIIDAINFTEFKKHPKWVIGYSDITVLHSHIHNLGVETLHAMMGINMTDAKIDTLQTVKTFKKALFGERLSYDIPSSVYNKTGTAKGQLVGGNLSILQSLLGSSSSINTKDKILFIEDVGEYLYQIDRMIYALKRSGYFKNCKGLIVGGITNITENDTPFGQTVEELILEATKEFDFPIIFDFPAGHDIDNRALFIGRKIKMKSKKDNSTVKFTK